MKGIQDTTNETYRKLMGNGLRYEIPKYQRDYSWEVEQWDDLWQDILLVLKDEEETEHYMGYLVLQTADNKNFIVIDGQQRLTTLSIIILGVLKSLTDLIKKGEDTEDNEIRLKAFRNSYIGTLDTVTLISNNKLTLNRNSNDYYRSNMVLLKDLPVRNTNASEKHMRECFLWFYRKLSEQFNTGKGLAEFVETIVDKLFFTVITVTDQINAFKVFETLNARGVQLSSADLLKNYLFSVIDQTHPHRSEIDELETLWSRIVGKLGGSKFEDYLRYFWNSKNKTVRKNQLFKTIRSAIKTKEQTFKLIRNLDDSADLYMALQDPNSDYWENNVEIVKPLRELKLFQIRQSNSLLISGFNNLDPSSFSKLLKAVSIISFRYNVIGGLNPNDLEDAYNKAAIAISSKKEFDIRMLQDVYVDDKAFRESFSTKQFKRTNRNHKIVKYILSKIERYQYHNEISSESDSYTIEHILPENADEEWGGLSDEVVSRSVNRLGNLTLLEKSLNREAGNADYETKKSFFKQSHCHLTKAVAEDNDTWNENKIRERQKEMSKAAQSIWRIQELR